MDELIPILQDRRQQYVEKFSKERRWGNKEGQEEAYYLLRDVENTLPITKKDAQLEGAPELRDSFQRLYGLMEAEKDGKTDKTNELARELGNLLLIRDNLQLEELRKRLPAKTGYDPADQKYRMLHLTYLEMRFDKLYDRAATWQQYPKEEVEPRPGELPPLGQAYRSGDTAKFDEATKDFLSTIQTVSEEVGPYPGEDTIGSRLGALLQGHSISPPSRQLLNLEMQFNRAAPFTWAWVLMLASLLFLCLSLGLGSRLCYWLGMGAFGVTLCFQLYGFFVRIIISGRPPVTNMYETVIWVAFMSAVFGLVLELIYKAQGDCHWWGVGGHD